MFRGWFGVELVAQALEEKRIPSAKFETGWGLAPFFVGTALLFKAGIVGGSALVM